MLKMSDCVMCDKVAIEKGDGGESLCVTCNHINKEIIKSKNGRNK